MNEDIYTVFNKKLTDKRMKRKSISYFVTYFVQVKNIVLTLPIMHQSIPNAPCTPPGNCGAFARLVSPGGGVFANLARPGGRAFANPGDNPEKFVDVFKGMFS